MKRNTNVTKEDYYKGVTTIAKKPRACYTANEDLSGLKGEDFVKVMTRDACALVEIIYKVTSNEERAKPEPNDGEDIKAILMDMLLLEN